MIFTACVIFAGAVVIAAYEPSLRLFARIRRHVERRRELERAEMRVRVAIARINHLHNAAQQAMWESSLDQARQELDRAYTRKDAARPA